MDLPQDNGEPVVCIWFFYILVETGQIEQLHCLYSKKQIAESTARVEARLSAGSDLEQFALVRDYPGFPEESKHSMGVLTGPGCELVGELIHMLDGSRVLRFKV
jgi:hypothetical protein